MRKYILLTVSFLFFAFVFQSDKPMGWFVQSLPRADVIINSISFLDSLTGYSAGTTSPGNDTGCVYKTTNGGVNWVQNYVAGQYRFLFIKFVNQNIGYLGTQAVPSGPNIFKTTDAGASWNKIYGQFAFGVSMSGLYFVNENTGWYSDENNTFDGGLYKTTNGGINWTLQLDMTYKPQKLFFLNQDTGWVTTHNFTRLYRTINGGTNWTLQSTFSGSISEVFFPTNDTGYAIAGNTGFMKTINGGFNWFSLNNPYDIAGITSLYFIDSKRGWYGGTLNTIFKTTDGITIRTQSTPTFRVNSIHFLDSNIGFGGGTAIVKTTDGGGMTPVFENNSNVPENFKLYQNYPNPFNPSTRINYELRITNYVTLKVYDLNGKEVTTLINKKQPAGSYTISFDAAKYNLSSGIYFYSLKTNKFTDTKKMILVK